MDRVDPGPELQGFIEALAEPVLVLEASGPDFRVVAASRAYARLAGGEPLAGRSVFDVVPGLLEALGPGELRTTLEAVLRERVERALPPRRLREPGPAERWWRPVFAPVLGPDGRPRHVAHRLEDVTEQPRPAEAPSPSEVEAQLKAFIRYAPVSIAMFDRQMNYLATSQRWLDDYGRGRPSLVGLNHYQVYPDLPAWWRDVHRRAQAGETLENKDELWVQADGSRRWVSWAVVPWRDAAGRIGGICISAEDVTGRKQAELDARHAEERRDFLLRLSDALRDLADPRQLQDEACRMLGQHLRASRVAYGEVLGDEAHVVTNYVDGVPSIVGRFPKEAFDQGHVTAWQLGGVTVYDDVQSDPSLPAEARQAWRSIEVAAYINVTLFKEGRWAAGLGVNSAQPRHWTPEEIELCCEAAERTWAAVQRAQAEAALRESEQRYLTIFEASPFAVALVRASDLALMGANAAFYRLFDLRPEEVLGRPRSELVASDPEQQARLLRELAERGSLRDVELTRPNRAGARLSLSLNVDRVTLHREQHLLVTIRDLTELKRGEEAARLYALSRERLLDLDAMERLHRVGTLFLREGEPGEAVLEAILEAAIAITEADFGNIQIFDPESEELRIAVHRGFPGWWLEFWERAARGRGVCGTALERGERVIVEDVARSEIFAGTEALQVQLRAGIRAVQSTPLRARSGAWVGMISTHYRTPRRPTDRALRMLDLLARQAADILERGRAGAALRAAEARASGILTASADAIISVGEDLRITLFNPAAERIFGYGAAEALGAPVETLLPERDRAAQREALARFARGAEPARTLGQQVGTGLRKGGAEFPVSASISRIEVGGRPVVTISVRDITEERRREEEQRLLAEVGGALSPLDYEGSLGRLLQVLARGLADFAVLFTVEDSGELHRFGAAARNPALAWSVEQMMRLPPRPPADHPVGEALATGRSVYRPLRPEEYEAVSRSAEHLRAFRAARPTDVVVVPLQVAGKAVGVLGLAWSSQRFQGRDQALAEEVGRRSALFLENARLLRAERLASQSRDLLLGVVAHDLRNPLAAITLQARMLSHDGPMGPRPERVGAAIARAASRMDRLIEDLLDKARLESGRLALERAPLDAGALAAEAVEAHQAQAADRGLTLQLELAPGLPPVWADRSRVAQVFENLIGNALKFTPRGGVRVGARPQDGEVLFWVADTGPGIASDVLPHVFDRFWQFRATGRSGAGLGLSIVKGIIEAHGGQVGVASQPGAGCTFTFTLPAAPSPAGREAHP